MLNGRVWFLFLKAKIIFAVSILNIRKHHNVMSWMFPSGGSIKDYLILYCQRGGTFYAYSWCILIPNPWSHRASSSHLEPTGIVKEYSQRKSSYFAKVFCHTLVISFSPLSPLPSASCSGQNIHPEICACVCISNIMFTVCLFVCVTGEQRLCLCIYDKHFLLEREKK